MKQTNALSVNSNKIEHVLGGYSDYSDNELIGLIAKYRDQEALSNLYQRYWHSIVCFLKRNECESSVVDELYNEIMLNVWSKAETYDGKSNVTTWLFNIAYQSRYSFTAKEKIYVSDMPNNQSVSQQRQAHIESHHAINALSEKNRTIIELSYFHDFTVTEIASIIGCSVDTVKGRLFYARQKLKEIL